MPIHHESAHALVNVIKKLATGHSEKQVNSLIVHIFYLVYPADHSIKQIRQIYGFRWLIFRARNLMQSKSTLLGQFKALVLNHLKQNFPGIALIDCNLLVAQPVSAHSYSL